MEEANSPCSLPKILADSDCTPVDFSVDDLPSRQRIIEAEEKVDKLGKTEVRSGVLGRLQQKLDCILIPNLKSQNFIKEKLEVDNQSCREIEKNTRGQNACKEWYRQRQCRLTSSLFGSVLNRRKTIYPKTIINKVLNKQTQTKNASCQ